MKKLKMQESETVELKKSLAELKQGLVSIAAILKKHRAGTLWFGVCNDSIITGIDPGEKTLRDLSQSIAAHIEPKILRQSLLEKKAWFSKKPQRSYPLCRERTTFYQCQGSGGSMWNEYS